MIDDSLQLLAVGDLILRGPKSNSFFNYVSNILRSADIVIGQGEVPFTNKSIPKYYLEIPTEFFAGDICDPYNMSAFATAGFNVITLAGNHLWDAGVPGITDTIDGLNKLHIATVGAGMNINEARRPIIIEKQHTKFGILDYNCVGPKLGWATPEKPGCAYIHIVSAYELEHPTPGGTPTIYTFAEPASLGAMIEDIQKLRALCDILVVCFHMGIGFTPAKIAMYEKQVSYTAIDFGADLVLGNHAHMLRGIEYYKNKPIFYGLNHFVLGSNEDTPEKPVPSWATQNFMKKSRELFGPYFQPGHGYPREALRTMIAKCSIREKKIQRVCYLPCTINDKGQPEILQHDTGGQEVFDYITYITQEEGFNTGYEWDNNEVVVYPTKQA